MPDPYVGEIRMFAGTFAPVGWAFCDGRELQVAEYSDLHDAIGNTYGSSGPTSFRLPNLGGRVAVGQGQGVGMTNRQLGQMGGAELVSMGDPQLPAHTHALQCTNELAETREPKDQTLASGLFGYASEMVAKDMSEMAIGTQGKGQGHYNLQKFLCVHFIIALTGRRPAAGAGKKELER